MTYMRTPSISEMPGLIVTKQEFSSSGLTAGPVLNNAYLVTSAVRNPMLGKYTPLLTYSMKDHAWFHLSIGALRRDHPKHLIETWSGVLAATKLESQEVQEPLTLRIIAVMGLEAAIDAKLKANL